MPRNPELNVKLTRDDEECGGLKLEAEVKESAKGKVPYITVREFTFVDASGKIWRCSAFNAYQATGKERGKAKNVIGKLSL